MRLPGGAVTPANVGYNGLLTLALIKAATSSLSCTTNFTDHHNRFRLWVVLEQVRMSMKFEPGIGSPPMPTRGLAKAKISGLFDGFIGERARARHNTYAARQMNVAGHDADFTFTWRDNAGAVRADQAHAEFVATHFTLQHIEGGNTFGDGHNQFLTPL